MGRLSVCGVLSLLAFLAGIGLLGFAGWILATVSAAPSHGDDFGAGFAVVGAFVAATLGVAAVGFALVITPARADGGVVVTIRRRQRQVSGVGLAVLAASLLVTLLALRVTGIVTALLLWLGLVAAGTLFVAVALVWTVGEAALIRAGVVG